MRRPGSFVLAALLASACTKDPAFIASDTATDTATASDTTIDTTTAGDTELTDADTTDADTVVAFETKTVGDVDASCQCGSTEICQVQLGCDGTSACATRNLGDGVFCNDPSLGSDSEKCTFGRLQPSSVCDPDGQCTASSSGVPDSLPLVGEWTMIVLASPETTAAHTLIGGVTVAGDGSLTAHDVSVSVGSQNLAARFASGTLCLGADYRVRLTDDVGATTYRGVYSAANDLLVFGGGDDHVLGFLVKAQKGIANLSGRYRTLTLDARGLVARTWAGELTPRQGDCPGDIGYDKSDGVGDRVWTQTTCVEGVGDLVVLTLSEVLPDRSGAPVAWTGPMTRDGELAVMVPKAGGGLVRDGVMLMMREPLGIEAARLPGLWTGVGRLDGAHADTFELQTPFANWPEVADGATWDRHGNMYAMAGNWYVTDDEGVVGLRSGADQGAGLVIRGAHSADEDVIFAYHSRTTTLDTGAVPDAVPAASASLIVLMKDGR
ncbi:MAG: hypothetical protein U1F43_05680 [Myxococcota bacterium]